MTYTINEGHLDCFAHQNFISDQNEINVKSLIDSDEEEILTDILGSSDEQIVSGYQLPEMEIGDWMIFGGISVINPTNRDKFDWFPAPEVWNEDEAKFW